MKKKIILIIVFGLIIVGGIISIVFSIIANYNLWLNEYNAQISQMGFYKEDIKILNQQIQSTMVALWIIASVIFIGGGILALIIVCLDD